MSTYDLSSMRQELLFFLRNSDVLTISERGVTTNTATGTFASTGSFTISAADVKNIRSVVVASVTLVFGQDYTVNLNSSSTCVITFVAPQTGAYTIIYDKGSDKIWPDYPRNDLTISSFPRIVVDLMPFGTSDGGFGNTLVSDPEFTVVIYASTTQKIQDVLSSVRNKFILSRNSFYYIGKAVKPTNIGPLITSPREQTKDKVFQQNLDFTARFLYEKN